MKNNKQLYIDTANKKEISFWLNTGAIRGITTNPSIVAKESKCTYNELILEIIKTIQYSYCKFLPISLSVEVTSINAKIMKEQAKQLDNLIRSNCASIENIVPYIKIPAHEQYFDLIHDLSNININVNATACFTAMQAKFAADAGAKVVSFFYNRMKDNHVDVDLEFDRFFKSTNYIETICGSIRKVDDIFECWNRGIEIVTVSPSILRQAITHCGTDEAIEQFRKDFETWQK